MQFENGAVVGCGIVSGELAPVYVFGSNAVAYTALCQGEANSAETLAIQRYRPGLIVWGSTDEQASIVVSTANGNKVLDSGSPEWESVMLQRMDTRVEKFIATGARVILLLEPPEVHHVNGANAQNVGALLNTPLAHGGGRPDAEDVGYERMNALLREVAARHPHHVAVVNLAARVCPSGPPCAYVVDGFKPKPTSVQQVLRPDGVHYLPAGSLWVANWLVPQIAAAAKGMS